MTTIHKVNMFATAPLRLFTYLLEYHGLSRFGMQLLGLCEAAIRPNTLFRTRKQEVLDYDSKTKELITSGSGVICFDNYNHSYGSAAIKLDRSTNMLLMNVTVGAMSLFRYPIDQKFVVLDSGKSPPTRMCLDPYREAVLQKLDDALIRCNDGLSRPFAYYEKSRVIRENTKTVPLTSPNQCPEDTIRADRFNLKSFRPIWVTARDSSLNLGIANIMMRIFNDYLPLLGEKICLRTC